QQRLTSLSLLLSYITLERENRIEDKIAEVKSLIVSDSFGELSYKLDVKGNREVFFSKVLANKVSEYEGEFENGNSTQHDETIKNLYYRYCEIEECLKEDIKGKLLPYFTDWL